MKKKIVILSGAGLDRESDILTFRDCEDGLWNNYKIDEVCTPEAWANDPTKVNDFYNMRRIEVLNAKPNRAHIALAEAEEEFDIVHVTQNVSDLLERAGCTKVIHLHGEILKARSSNPHYDVVDDTYNNPYKTYPVGREGLTMNDMADDGFPLRPEIVWFGEPVPLLADGAKEIQEADALIIVGTSLEVYPAAGLVWHANCPIWTVDPALDFDSPPSIPTRIIKNVASSGIPIALAAIKKYFAEKEQIKENISAEIENAINMYIGSVITPELEKCIRHDVTMITKKYKLSNPDIELTAEKIHVSICELNLVLTLSST